MLLVPLCIDFRDSCYKKSVWLGLYRPCNLVSSAGNFYWINGTSPNFTDWFIKQPDNNMKQSPLQQFCVVTDKSNLDSWRDMQCGQAYPFVCQARDGNLLWMFTLIWDKIIIAQRLFSRRGCLPYSKFYLWSNHIHKYNDCNYFNNKPLLSIQCHALWRHQRDILLLYHCGFECSGCTNLLPKELSRIEPANHFFSIWATTTW